MSRLTGSRKAGDDEPRAQASPAAPDAPTGIPGASGAASAASPSGSAGDDTVRFSLLDSVRLGHLRGIVRRGTTGRGAPGRAPARARAPRPERRQAGQRSWHRARPWLPGRTFAAMTQFPALLAIAWLLPGVGTLLAGRLVPTALMVIFVPLAVALCYFSWRRLPERWPRFGSPAATLAAGIRDETGATVASGTSEAPDGAGTTGAGDAGPKGGTGTAGGTEAGAAAAGPGAAADSGGTAAAGGPAASGETASSGPAAPGDSAKHARKRRAAKAGAARAARSKAERRWVAVPAWPVIATAVICLGFTVWQALEHSHQVIVARDPGEYLQYGYWIAHHGTSTIPVSVDAFGGAGLHGITFASPGFLQSGSSLSPAFLPGLPLVLAGGIWAGGITGGLLMAPVLGGCALLSFAGLAGRLVGAKWAPAAALVLGLTLPQQYVSRTTLAEPLVQVLLFGGLCLVIDSFAVRRPDPAGAAATATSVPGSGVTGAEPATAAEHPWAVQAPVSRPVPAWQSMTLAGFGGLAIGLSVLASIGSLSLVLPLFPLLAIMLVARLPQALPMAIGLLAGIGLGAESGSALARPYLETLRPQLHTLGLAAAGFGVLTVAVAPLVVPGVRRQIQRALGWRLALAGLSGKTHQVPLLAVALEGLALLLPVATLVGLAVRPGIQVTRGAKDPFIIAFVASVQKLQGLPVDGRQQYYEQSLNWLVWYIGVPAALLATIGAALIGRRCVRALIRGRVGEPAARTWGIALPIFAWATGTTLLDPAILPDQPWASRRLATIVVPAVICLGLWTCSRVRLRAAELGAGRVTGAVVAACSIIAMALPAAVTVFDPGYTGSGSARELAVRGMAFKQTYGKEQYAVSTICSALGPSASVILTDHTTAEAFTQVIRGMCNVPAARMDGASAADVAQVTMAIQQSGRRPVLLGSTESSVRAAGATPKLLLRMQTTQDAHTLTGPPSAPWDLTYTIWMASPASP